MNTVKVPLPGGSNVRLVGITNSGGWTQQIAFTDPGGHSQTWTGRGGQTNNIVGTYIVGAEEAGDLTVTMTWDDGSGAKPSAVKVDAFNLLGMSGYVIGGQDGGGRPKGDAYWNTMLLVYWAVGY